MNIHHEAKDKKNDDEEAVESYATPVIQDTVHKTGNQPSSIAESASIARMLRPNLIVKGIIKKKKLLVPEEPTLEESR